MAVWRITHYQGAYIVSQHEAPGHLSEAEMVKTLERLVARHLDEDEVIAGSLRRNDPGYRHDFEVLKDTNSRAPKLWTDGTDHHYTAVWHKDA